MEKKARFMIAVLLRNRRESSTRFIIARAFKVTLGAASLELGLEAFGFLAGLSFVGRFDGGVEGLTDVVFEDGVGCWIGLAVVRGREGDDFFVGVGNAEFHFND